MSGVNPIRIIREIDGSGVTHTVPPPAKFKWKLEDVSKPNAGRDSNGLMHKEKIRQVVGVELEWAYLTTAQAKQVLNAFQSEYLDIEYLDPLNGLSSDNYYIRKTFYVGDRSAPLYSTTNDRWENIAFNIIER